MGAADETTGSSGGFHKAAITARARGRAGVRESRGRGCGYSGVETPPFWLRMPGRGDTLPRFEHPIPRSGPSPLVAL